MVLSVETLGTPLGDNPSNLKAIYLLTNPLIAFVIPCTIPYNLVVVPKMV